MSISASITSEVTAAIVNPLLKSTIDVFETMLGCRPVRTALRLKQDMRVTHEVSGVIGVTGRANGVIVLSMSRVAALGTLRQLVGIEATEIDASVCDAVGEVTNMIAGSAKSKLESLQLSISIPSIISGTGHDVRYPTGIQPISIAFDSAIGMFCVEAGFAPAW